MTIQESLNKLFSLHTFGIKLGLDNTRAFLEYLDNPQKKIKTIHVAGSNGKGSTSAFLASMLTEFGYKTGLYTSPHFIRFNERIKIGNEEIPDDFVAGFVEKHEKKTDELKLTFFEVTTAIAFEYFESEKVDYAVIETGLGGRLDATNVLDPIAVVITSISLEHTSILGETLDKIASEKAGIIKNNVPVFTGNLPRQAFDVIERKCKDLNCNLFRLEEYVINRTDSIELYTEEIELDDFSMPLRGNYQKLNAALAGLVISKTFISDDYDHIEKGIKNVINNTGLQGRYEYFHNQPDIIFDSAHNPDGIKSFLSEFSKDYKGYGKKTLLFAAMKEKAIGEMLEDLGTYFDEIRVTQIEYERSAKIDDLIRVAGEKGIKAIAERNIDDFILGYMNNSPEDCLVVLGSIYLLGEVKSRLQNKLA
jgi:dihydrofolate synthase/folylpolyglutamate synthase